MLTLLTVAGLTFAALFLAVLIRAMIFGHRHRHRFADSGLAERSVWWFRLFRRDGFGPKAEAERRRLARALILTGLLFFAIGALIQVLAVPR